MRQHEDNDRSDFALKGSAEQLTLRLFIVSLLLLAAALIFFSCRETDGKPNDSSARVGSTPSPNPSAALTGGRKGDRFADGTFVLGVNVGGMTRENAAAELKGRVDAELESYECRFSYGEESGRSSDIIMDGGTLHVEWRQADEHVYLTGPAEFVFEGEIWV